MSTVLKKNRKISMLLRYPNGGFIEDTNIILLCRTSEIHSLKYKKPVISYNNTWESMCCSMSKSISQKIRFLEKINPI